MSVSVSQISYPKSCKESNKATADGLRYSSGGITYSSVPGSNDFNPLSNTVIACSAAAFCCAAAAFCCTAAAAACCLAVNLAVNFSFDCKVSFMDFNILFVLLANVSNNLRFFVGFVSFSPDSSVSSCLYFLSKSVKMASNFFLSLPSKSCSCTLLCSIALLSSISSF